MNTKKQQTIQAEQNQIIGNSIFRQDFTKKIQNEVFGEDLSRVLSLIAWQIIEDNYQQWDSIFFYMIKSKVHILSIHYILSLKYESLIKNVTKVHFTDLKKLSLNNINLRDVEFIEFIWTQKLIDLNLKNNKITSLKPFKKIVFRFLEKLSIDNNLFIESQYLNRMKISHQSYFKLFFCSDQQIFVQDIAFLGKTQKEKCNDVISEFGIVKYFHQTSQKSFPKKQSKAIQRMSIFETLFKRYSLKK